MKTNAHAHSNTMHIENPAYRDIHHTEPQPTPNLAHYSSQDTSYDIQNASSKHSEDEHHTYAVIPADRSTAVGKRPASLMDNSRELVLHEVSAAPPPPIPRRFSACDTSIPQRLSIAFCSTRQSSLQDSPTRLSVLHSDSLNEPQGNIYQLPDREYEESSDGEHIYHILEDGGFNDSNEQTLGRISWFGSDAGVICAADDVSSISSEEDWEGRTPTTYEVPKSLLAVQDEIRSL